MGRGTGGATVWGPCKMEATLGPVYTAQQMAAGAAGCAIVKISPGARGRVCLDDATGRARARSGGGRGAARSSSGASPPRGQARPAPSSRGQARVPDSDRSAGWKGEAAAELKRGSAGWRGGGGGEALSRRGYVRGRDPLRPGRVGLSRVAPPETSGLSDRCRCRCLGQALELPLGSPGGVGVGGRRPSGRPGGVSAGSLALPGDRICLQFQGLPPLL